MAARAERNQVVARLREEIRRIERRPARRDGCVACGLADVDALLPDGGFRRGALTELAGGPASGKTAIALALIAALGPGDLAAYVDGREELYPPAAAALGVDLTRLLVVRPASRTVGEGPVRGDPALVTLWAAEALLASGAFAVVAVDVPIARTVRGVDSAARRLQAAAEKGGAVGLWLAGRGATGLRVPAAVRLELNAEDGRIIGRRRHMSADGRASGPPHARGGLARGTWSPQSREADEAVPRLRSRASAGPTLGMNGPEPGTRGSSSAGVSFSGSGALRRACERAEQHSDEPARHRQASCAAASHRPEDGDAA
jgi:protein ImuA